MIGSAIGLVEQQQAWLQLPCCVDYPFMESAREDVEAQNPNSPTAAQPNATPPSHPQSQTPRPLQRILNIPVPIVLIVLFLIFLLVNHSGDEFLAKNQYQTSLDTLNWQFGNLSAWLNGTETNYTLVRDGVVLFGCPVFTHPSPVTAA